ncbi:hypothetical protein RI129_008654 [Pyrocoelia pectoralis]|uniref:DUF4806 domain-containing protein n=1 Tax=Pyrocoelia pectoralis TaxID=417401 RepID=A0AAN7ZHK5_9COLE
MQQHNRNKENKYRDINSSSELSETLALFPIKNVEDLEKVENLIKAKQYLEDGLAKDLSRIGGENSVKITKRIMYRAMTNEVGQLFSFEGAKGKNIFKNLTLFSTIIKAVRLNAQMSDATDMDIVNTIKLWLAQAKNRLKNKRSQMNDEGEEN